jgi:DNA invertase Pin-like site-specific DNA recombinase
LVAFAKRDGYIYSENEEVSELVIIQDKESATKLSDEERRGLTKMYAAINNRENQIECVYAWEISRISRKPPTLHKIKEELVARKINLKTKQENFVLLNESKEENPISDLSFSLLVSMYRSEIRAKVERFKRTKRANALKSGYNGGNIRYGYLPDPDTKIYKVHPEQGEVVRLLFELYSTGEYGFGTLHKELLRRGKNININTIDNILRSEEYTSKTMPAEEYKVKIKGKETSITKYERVYPQ